EFERISRHHKTVSAGTWNPTSLNLELRACLLLNRFTRNLSVMYASPSCQLIFGIDPDDLLGKPILLYIRADEIASFVEQGDRARSSSSIRHMRFWFQSPNCHEEIPCEAVFYGASDALIMILRKCLPFKRRQLITDSNPSSSSRRLSAYSDMANWRCSSDLDSDSEDSRPYGRFQNTHSIRGDTTETVESTDSQSMYSSSLDESLSSSFTSFQSTASQDSRGARVHRASLGGISVGSISTIRNLDREQHRLRPLTSLQEENSDIAETGDTLTAGYLLREFNSQELEVIESEVEEGIEEMNLRSGYRSDVLEDEEAMFYSEEEYRSEGNHYSEGRHYSKGKYYSGEHYSKENHYSKGKHYSEGENHFKANYGGGIGGTAESGEMEVI
ncbi:hypothetical protein BGZ80_003120, partial [Entomortierella chlamydospora]